MSLLNDPRDVHFEHVGVKGMKWGVRKAIYTKQKSNARTTRNEAENLRQLATEVESGKSKVDRKWASTLRKYADEDEASGTNPGGVKSMRKLADDIQSGKNLSTNQQKKVKSLRDSADVLDKEADSWDKVAAKNKRKIDKLAIEVAKTKAERETAVEERQIRNGREFVNNFFTGNREGRITKGTVAQYALGAGLIGAMVVANKRK
jgi:hypothetical protein